VSAEPIKRVVVATDFSDSSERALTVAIGFAKLMGVDRCFSTTQGVPADEIVTHANRTAAELIVMGTHGRTGIRRVLLGSVAEQVLHKARCPVLVVPPLRETTM